MERQPPARPAGPKKPAGPQGSEAGSRKGSGLATGPTLRVEVDIPWRFSSPKACRALQLPFNEDAAQSLRRLRRQRPGGV